MMRSRAVRGIARMKESYDAVPIKASYIIYGNALGGGHHGFRRFVSADAIDAVAFFGVFEGDFDFFLGFAVEEGLGDGGQVTDDDFFRVGVPSAEDDVWFGWLFIDVGDGDLGADADDLGAGVGEIGAAGANELGFEF